MKKTEIRVSTRDGFRRHLSPFFSFLLRRLPSHKLRKRFAKTIGPYFRGTVATTAYGFQMICDWYDNANRIIFEGSLGEVEAFIRELPRKSIFLDIGANQGGTSILAAKVLGELGAVLAYEPNPGAARVMRENIDLNHCNNVYLFERGVASECTKSKLDTAHGEDSGAAHVADTGIAVNLEPITLAELEAIGPRVPVFVKIDTEGFEMEVLKGLRELFSANRIHKMIVEINDLNLARFGSSARQLYEYLEGLGFNPHHGLRDGHYDEVFSRQ